MSTHRQLPLPSAGPIEVNEQVRVVVDFRGPKVRPLAFLWRNWKITVTKTNMVFKR
jgi:hypothetical protein